MSQTDRSAAEETLHLIDTTISRVAGHPTTIEALHAIRSCVTESGMHPKGVARRVRPVADRAPAGAKQALNDLVDSLAYVNAGPEGIDIAVQRIRQDLAANGLPVPPVRRNTNLEVTRHAH